MLVYVCYLPLWPNIKPTLVQHYNLRKSAHGQFEFFNTVTLIGSLLVSQGQKGANNMWPLKTITRGHGGSESLPSSEGSGGEAY